MGRSGCGIIEPDALHENNKLFVKRISDRLSQSGASDFFRKACSAGVIGSISAFQAGGTGSSPVCYSNKYYERGCKRMISVMFETKQKALDYLKERGIIFWDILYIAESVDGCELVYKTR